MSSIRRHILVWVLPGFLFIWIVAGCALYFSVKQRYEVELDSELREIRAALPFGNSSGRASLLSIEDFAKDDFGIYFQVWNKDGLRILKSENLGRFDLPRSSSFSEEPAYHSFPGGSESTVAGSTRCDEGGYGSSKGSAGPRASSSRSMT